MHIVAIAWVFVVVLMAAAEATSTQGTVLGALITLVLYGLLPLSIVLYILGAPARRAVRRRAEAAALAEPDSAVHQGDASGHATGDTVAAERKET